MANELTIPIGTQFRSAADTKYKVVQRIGSGGNCVVWLVLALNGQHHGVLFALKVFTRMEDEDRLTHFHTETEFLSAAHHAAIMRVHDRGDYRDHTTQPSRSYPFMIADYLPRTLQDEMRGRITMPEKLVYALQLLSALKYLEEQQPAVVHRDIKPANIFLNGRSCILGDFGLMRKVDDNCTDAVDVADRMFKMSEGPGIPRGYRTPDLVRYARQEAPITTKSDVFQLGLVLAELFTGTVPLERYKNILDDVVVRQLSPIASTHAHAIHGLLQRMLESEPQYREAAAALIDEWEGILAQVVNHYHVIKGRVF